MSGHETVELLDKDEQIRAFIGLPSNVLDPQFIVWNRNVYTRLPRRPRQIGSRDLERAQYRQVFAWWATPEGR